MKTLVSTAGTAPVLALAALAIVSLLIMRTGDGAGVLGAVVLGTLMLGLHRRPRRHLQSSVRTMRTGGCGDSAAILTRNPRRRAALAVAIGPALVVVSPGLAVAASEVPVRFSVAGSPGAGPSKYDRIQVQRFGRSAAPQVLLLVPGGPSGAGQFTALAREVVRRDRSVQVWAMDRRSEALEDTRVMRAALAGAVSPKRAFDFYLGWLTNPGRKVPHYEPPDDRKLSFARDWGMAVSVRDIDRVVRRAKRGGRKVVLGGHSLGAGTAVAYAAWDFNGRPGHRNVAGLVLLDGALRGAAELKPVADLRREAAAIRSGDGSPFFDQLGLGIPWTAGAFGGLLGLLAQKEPTAPSRLQASGLLPKELQPPVPVTNRALLGYVLDKSTSPDSLAAVRVRSGGLGAGPLADWVNGEISPIASVASYFAQEPVNSIEWFFPRRLLNDLFVAIRGDVPGLERDLGLRLRHERSIDVPIYAVQSDLSGGRVLRSARAIGRRGTERVLVDASDSTSHLDILTARASKSPVVRTLPRFLRNVRHSAAR